MKRAFTLLELLLVIIIILILASIIFPIMSAAKEAGYRSQAVVQSQELGEALQMYAQGVEGNIVPSTN
jgi:prepilin-type N-terminal cleavage/methylation domain-containing protein